MHLAAAGDHLLLEFLEIEIEMGERALLQRLGFVAQRLELGQPVVGFAPPGRETDASEIERAAPSA